MDQTNIVGDQVVAGANEVSQAGVEGVENVAASTGLMNQVGHPGNHGLHRQLPQDGDLLIHYPQQRAAGTLQFQIYWMFFIITKQFNPDNP